DGSYGLRQQLNRALREEDDKYLASFRYLQAYEFFRDCARWLGDGAFPWARSWRSSRNRQEQANALQQDGIRPEDGADLSQVPFRALFIDENLGPDASSYETLRLRSRISEVFSLLFAEGTFELDVIHSADGALPTPEEHANTGGGLDAVDGFFEHVLPQRI